MTNEKYPNFVLPKVYLVGYTTLNVGGLTQYLEETGQTEFIKEVQQAEEQKLSDGEILCSFYAKLCYKSLVLGKNDNISKVRAIADNIEATINSGHGSVFEHCNLNFVTTNCSRIYTHELVRHRVGTAFSQTSGRYVRSDSLKVVIDPILEPIYSEIEELRNITEDWYNKMVQKLGLNEMKNFDAKKKMTSALRRMMPNGQSNEMGFSMNLRTLRQTIEARTSRHAEWEIRFVGNQVYELVKDKYPAIFADSKIEIVEGLGEITFKNKKI
jgi:thymidylate synthase (FAD)